jgi:hypothetical protein
MLLRRRGNQIESYLGFVVPCLLIGAGFVCGVIGVIGGIIALVAFGRQDPLGTVWDNRDERTPVAAS